MSNLDNIFELLDELGEQLDIQKRENEKLALTNAPYFNPFEFFRTDEMGLSKLIAFLLDSKQSHGQGRMFLDRFLINLDLHKYLGYESVKVTVEQSLKDSSRRHDIFIQGIVDGEVVWVISIENKLRDAEDQKNQISDYLKDLPLYLSDKSNDYVLIYLPVFDKEPDSNSIAKTKLDNMVEKGHVKLINAEVICQWLDDIIPYASNVRSFIEQFSKFIRENIMQLSNEETMQLVENLCDDEANLKAALQLISSQNAIYDNLMNILKEQLRQKSKEIKSWKFDFYYDDAAVWNGTNKGFFIERNGFIIEYKTQRVRFNDWFFAISSEDQFVDDWIDEDIIKLSKWRRYKNQNLWKYSSENKYKNWNSETWLEVLDGRLSDYIIQEFQECVNFLKENKAI